MKKLLTMIALVSVSACADYQEECRSLGYNEGTRGFSDCMLVKTENRKQRIAVYNATSPYRYGY